MSKKIEINSVTIQVDLTTINQNFLINKGISSELIVVDKGIDKGINCLYNLM